MLVSLNLFSSFDSHLNLSAGDEKRLSTLDWNNPKIDDLKYLQDLYDRNSNGILHHFDCYDEDGNPVVTHRRSRVKNFKFYTADFKTVPKLRRIFLDKENKGKRCIVLYVGTNGKFSAAVRHLINDLRNSNYSGDILCQIGGWPYLKEDALKAFFTPYGFKPCILMDVLRRGYETALWIDAVYAPFADLNSVFDEIEKQDVWLVKDPVPFSDPMFKLKNKYNGEDIRKYYEITNEELSRVPHISTAIMGFNLKSESTRSLLFSWFKMAKDCTPFLYPVPSQLPFSVLVERTVGLKKHVIHSDRRFKYFKYNKYIAQG